MREWVGNGAPVLVRRALAGTIDHSGVDDAEAEHALFFIPALGVSARQYDRFGAALMYFTLIGFRPSLNLIIAGHMIVTIPFILRTTTASLSQLDPALNDCSQSLGASWLYTLRRVTLPLIAPAKVSRVIVKSRKSAVGLPGRTLIVSTASLIVGVAAASPDIGGALVAGGIGGFVSLAAWLSIQHPTDH